MHRARMAGLAAGLLAAAVCGGSLTADAAGATTASPSTGVSAPQSDPLYPSHGSSTLDALHYALDLHWNDHARWLAGTDDIDFRAPQDERRVRLDMAWPLRVITVSLDGRAVHSVHRGDHLFVSTGVMTNGSRHHLQVVYGGHPRPLYLAMTRSDIRSPGWTPTPTGQVWTMQEPFGASSWFPVDDQPADKAFYDIALTTKREWTGVSNGALVSNRVTGGVRRTVWHLDSPAASYLITVAIGPYHRYVDHGPHGLPISYWVRPKDRGSLHILRRSPALLRWLEGRLGRYPFSTAGVVVVPGDSAMETQSLVTMSSRLFAQDGAGTLLHELAHQWYGDLVTPRAFRDLWMNESFAMYLQIRWEATHGGPPMRFWRQYLNNTDALWRWLYGPPGAFKKWTFASNNVYYCGALMLDRLRTKIGPRMFARVLRGWPQQHRFGNGSRTQWRRYLDATTHRHLDPFVHAWLMSHTTPG
ncbi:MAG TPA: M1 family metallopeptidase [Mycobacteriales bacterium]|nr:M1 family metallopeptidase [Mycobacteriales bacterium]